MTGTIQFAYVGTLFFGFPILTLFDFSVLFVLDTANLVLMSIPVSSNALSTASCEQPHPDTTGYNRPSSCGGICACVSALGSFHVARNESSDPGCSGSAPSPCAISSCICVRSTSRATADRPAPALLHLLSCYLRLESSGIWGHPSTSLGVLTRKTTPRMTSFSGRTTRSRQGYLWHLSKIGCWKICESIL